MDKLLHKKEVHAILQYMQAYLTYDCLNLNGAVDHPRPVYAKVVLAKHNGLILKQEKLRRGFVIRSAYPTYSNLYTALHTSTT